jgi:hypothetical protein
MGASVIKASEGIWNIQLGKTNHGHPSQITLGNYAYHQTHAHDQMIKHLSLFRTHPKTKGKVRENCLWDLILFQPVKL